MKEDVVVFARFAIAFEDVEGRDRGDIAQKAAAAAQALIDDDFFRLDESYAEEHRGEPTPARANANEATDVMFGDCEEYFDVNGRPMPAPGDSEAHEAHVQALEEELRGLASVLAECVGDGTSDKWGYGAAHKALDEGWRKRAQAALAQAKARLGL